MLNHNPAPNLPPAEPLPLPTVPISTSTFADLAEAIYHFVPDADVTDVERAYEFARKAHAGQRRRSGEEYIQHPLEVALNVVRDIHLVNKEALAAALLHDVLEDNPAYKREDIEKEFGPKVAALVVGLTKFDKATNPDKLAKIKAGEEISDEQMIANAELMAELEKEHAQAENLRKMFLSMSEDLRVVFIKLADRLHNIRTLAAQPPHKHRRIAAETLEIYAPLANRLGMSAIKNELEDLCFRYLQPETYARISKDLQERKADHERYLKAVIDEIKQALEANGINAQVKGRGKHIYGVWRKMQRKNKPIDQIYDVLGIRIILSSGDGDREDQKWNYNVLNCYTALGVVHTCWRAVTAEFDDYIKTPRNGTYRSLHTTVNGPEGRPIEFQIRTSRMNEEAEYGIAAHWRYKEDIPSDEKLQDKIASMRHLIDWMKDVSSASEFVDDFKAEAFQDYIYVFTPQGDVKELPVGSTPIDFAYYIHTEVGHHVVRASVDGQNVPLNTPLQNGQVVSVVSGKNMRPGPSRDWLDEAQGFVTSPSVRGKIRQWFHRQLRGENIGQGKQLLEAELRRQGLSGKKPEEITALFPRRYRTIDDFYAAIGEGEISQQNLYSKLSEISEKEMQKRLREGEASSEGVSKVLLPASGQGSISLQGHRNLASTMAPCCHPMPGDDVMGYVTKGRGITVHRDDCSNIINVRDTDRLLKVDWGEGEGGHYPVPILVEGLDRKGFLNDLTAVIAGSNINIAGISTSREERRGTVSLRLILEVENMKQFADVVRRINAMPGVYQVYRVTHDVVNSSTTGKSTGTALRPASRPANSNPNLSRRTSVSLRAAIPSRSNSPKPKVRRAQD